MESLEKECKSEDYKKNMTRIEDYTDTMDKKYRVCLT